MTTSSRNPAIRNMAERDGEAATKAYVKDYYKIPDHIDDWKTIDDIAYKTERENNKKP